jgi:hypothetical protein
VVGRNDVNRAEAGSGFVLAMGTEGCFEIEGEMTSDSRKNAQDRIDRKACCGCLVAYNPWDP